MPDRDSEPTISASGLVRRFGSHVAVAGISVELSRGEVLGFLGPNGAGKTTTMQMLTGNLAPTAGEVRICGIDLLDEPLAAKSRIGYLPEVPPLYRELTVDEFLTLAGRLHRLRGDRCGHAVAEAKRRCGLAETGGRLIGALSKGYQQRVGIAQAILHGPDVIILDEPTIGLDPIQVREIRGLIRELAGAHSVILSTHILPEVEAVCDRVQIMNRGVVVYNDSIAALKELNSGNTVLVGLRHAPPLDALASIPGVAAAEEVEPSLFRIKLSGAPDACEALVQHAVAGGWGLVRLQPAQASLEEVFLNLTQREDT